MFGLEDRHTFCKRSFYWFFCKTKFTLVRRPRLTANTRIASWFCSYFTRPLSDALWAERKIKFTRKTKTSKISSQYICLRIVVGGKLQTLLPVFLLALLEQSAMKNYASRDQYVFICLCVCVFVCVCLFRLLFICLFFV